MAEKTFLDCFIYQVQGKDVLMTSLIVPIVIEGEYYGQVGIDIRLEFLQQLVDKSDVSNTGKKLLLISNNGLLAAVTGQPELIGKSAL